MADLKQLAAITALNNMFVKGWFDICTIDSVAKMLGRAPGGEAYDLLRTLHCIHWDKMPKDLRDEVPRLIRECLDVEPVFQFDMPAVADPPAFRVIEPPPQEKRSLIRRLLP